MLKGLFSNKLVIFLIILLIGIFILSLFTDKTHFSETNSISKFGGSLVGAPREGIPLSGNWWGVTSSWTNTGYVNNIYVPQTGTVEYFGYPNNKSTDKVKNNFLRSYKDYDVIKKVIKPLMLELFKTPYLSIIDPKDGTVLIRGMPSMDGNPAIPDLTINIPGYSKLYDPDAGLITIHLIVNCLLLSTVISEKMKKDIDEIKNHNSTYNFPQESIDQLVNYQKIHDDYKNNLHLSIKSLSLPLQTAISTDLLSTMYIYKTYNHILEKDLLDYVRYSNETNDEKKMNLFKRIFLTRIGKSQLNVLGLLAIIGLVLLISMGGNIWAFRGSAGTISPEEQALYSYYREDMSKIGAARTETTWIGMLATMGGLWGMFIPAAAVIKSALEPKDSPSHLYAKNLPIVALIIPSLYLLNAVYQSGVLSASWSVWGSYFYFLGQSIIKTISGFYIFIMSVFRNVPYETKLNPLASESSEVIERTESQLEIELQTIRNSSTPELFSTTNPIFKAEIDSPFPERTIGLTPQAEIEASAEDIAEVSTSVLSGLRLATTTTTSGEAYLDRALILSTDVSSTINENTTVSYLGDGVTDVYLGSDAFAALTGIFATYVISVALLAIFAAITSAFTININKCNSCDYPYRHKDSTGAYYCLRGPCRSKDATIPPLKFNELTGLRFGMCVTDCSIYNTPTKTFKRNGIKNCIETGRVAKPQTQPLQYVDQGNAYASIFDNGGSNCTFSTDKALVSNACNVGNIKLCPKITSQPIKEVIKVFNNGLILWDASDGPMLSPNIPINPFNRIPDNISTSSKLYFYYYCDTATFRKYSFYLSTVDNKIHIEKEDNSPQCGYGPPFQCPAGTEATTPAPYCDGTTRKYYTYNTGVSTNGNISGCATTLQSSPNTPPCVPAAGSNPSTVCQGYNLVTTSTNGLGGTRIDNTITNVPACGYQLPNPVINTGSYGFGTYINDFISVTGNVVNFFQSPFTSTDVQGNNGWPFVNGRNTTNYILVWTNACELNCIRRTINLSGFATDNILWIWRPMTVPAGYAFVDYPYTLSASMNNGFIVKDKNNNTISTNYLQTKFVNPQRSSLGLSFDFTNRNLTLKYMGGVSGYTVITALTITYYAGSTNAIEL